MASFFLFFFFFCNEHLDSEVLRSCQALQLEFVSTTKREEAELRMSGFVALLRSVSLSGVTNTRIKSSEKCVKCGVEQKMAGYSHDRRTRKRRVFGVQVGDEWTIPLSSWREWRLLLYTLHTLFNGPFLRQTNWTNLT